MAGSDPGQEPREHGKFAGKDGPEHILLGFPQDGIEAALAAAGLAPRAVEPPKSRAVKQDTGNDVQPFIAGGSGNGRKPWQCFILFKNLFNDDVHRLLSKLAFDLQLQAPQIVMRVAQAVDMVESQAL